MSGGDEGVTVGVTAALVGVSVRTLHHWDEVGLVRPSGRTRAGYRVYSAGDLARLHRVLVYREVGIPLAQIGPLLDDPSVDEVAHLRRQRALLIERITHLQQMVCAVDSVMEVTMRNTTTLAELAEIFGTDWRPEYEDEAEQRWGDIDPWAQSQERTCGMSRTDWEEVEAEGDRLDADMAAAVRDGTEPGSPAADRARDHAPG